MFPPEYNTELGIKICGFREVENLARVAELGVDALGINLWPKSKRYLPLDTAVAQLRPIAERQHLVAVLVNADAELLAAVESCGLFRSLQLHGDETPQMVSDLMQRGIHVIKALQVRDAGSLDQIAAFPCRDILLDAYNPGLYGGGGHAFPWGLASEAMRRFPEKRIILSGGLNPENIAEAVQQTGPAAVDVASGVESAPGIKDLVLVRTFIERARGCPL